MIMLLAASLLLAAQSGTFLENPDFKLGAQGWTFDANRIKIESTVGPESKPAIRLQMRGPFANPWDAQLTQNLKTEFKAGDELEVSFWARSANQHRVGALLQLGEAPFSSFTSQELTLSPEWQKFSLGTRFTSNLAREKAQIALHFGFGDGQVDLASFDARKLAPARETMSNPTTLIARSAQWRSVGTGYLKIETTREGHRFIPSPPENAAPWTVNVRKSTTESVRPGQTILIKARMRSSSRARVAAIFELDRPPHSKPVSQTVGLTPEWKEYRFGGVSDVRLAPGEGAFVLFLGLANGPVEVADVEVLNVGNTNLTELSLTLDFLGGLDNPTTWKTAANKRIEVFRKGDLTVKVIDAQGRPVRNAQVRVEQQQHEFRFGTAVVASLINGTDATSAKYREILEKNFNAAVFENDMKWGNPTPPEEIDRALKWLETRNFQTRGHNLLWGAERYVPADVRPLDTLARRKVIEDRVVNWMNRWKGRLYAWDVVNEPVNEPWLWQQDGESLFGEVHRLARKTDPNVKLVLNDYNWTEENATGSGVRKRLMAWSKKQIDSGVPIDLMGLQCHLSLPVTPHQRVLELLDEISSLGRPLEITEYDLVCADNAFHAQYSADYLRMAFSHPNVESFILWGFWANAHWMGPTAVMWNADWSERPVVKLWRDQIYREWWTEASLRTDSSGSTKLRAFYGTHKIAVKVGERSAEMTLKTKPGQPAIATIRL